MCLGAVGKTRETETIPAYFLLSPNSGDYFWRDLANQGPTSRRQDQMPIEYGLLRLKAISCSNFLPKFESSKRTHIATHAGDVSKGCSTLADDAEVLIRSLAETWPGWE